NFFEDATGTMWFGNTVGLWHTSGERLVRFGAELINAQVIQILPRRDGSIWVSTSGGGLFRVAKDNSVSRIGADHDADVNDVTQMFDDSRGALWLAGNKSLWAWREK